MADRVHPSSKPTPTAPAATATTPAPAATKPQPRPPYRPPPSQYNQHRRRRRSSRSLCCCCCFWSILLLLIAALVASIAGAAVYVLYRPHRPEFTLTSLRLSRLNLTTAADSSSSHLSSSLNLTVAVKNPNAHLTFFYDAFAVAVLTDVGAVRIAEGTIPPFVGQKKNQTVFRTVAAASESLDTDATTSLRSDLRRRSGVPMRIEMDTKVMVKIESVKTKKVGIRVTCDGIKAVAPKGRTPTVVSLSGTKCKVDLRIKIWKWTF